MKCEGDINSPLWSEIIGKAVDDRLDSVGANVLKVQEDIKKS